MPSHARSLIHLALTRVADFPRPLAIVGAGRKQVDTLVADAGVDGSTASWFSDPEEIDGSGASVALLPAAAVEDVDTARVVEPYLVLWAEHAADLPDHVREWVHEDGVLLDATPGLTDAPPAGARVADELGKEGGLVAYIGAAGDEAFLADEMVLRLEARGTPAMAVDWDDIAAALPRAEQGVVPVIRASRERGKSDTEGLCSAIESGASAVLVACPETWQSLARHEAWADLLERATRIDVQRVVADDGVAEPSANLEDLIVGPPAIAPERPRLMQGSLTGMPVVALLQSLGMQGLTGRLAIYSPRRFGTLSFQRGRVTGARRLGDTRTAAQLTERRGGLGDPSSMLVEEVIAYLARAENEDGAFSFLSDPAAEGAQAETLRLRADSLALEVVRITDERPLRVRQAGGRWRRLGGAPAAGTAAAHLWAQLATPQTLPEAAAAAGLLEFEAMDALGALREEGRVDRVAGGEIADELALPHRVATELLSLGLREEALRTLEKARKQACLTPSACVLAGHLLASDRPAEARKYFRTAAKALGAKGSRGRRRSEAVTATLNAAWVGVRSGVVPPGAAWSEAAHLLPARSDLSADQRTLLDEIHRLTGGAPLGEGASAE